jgi:hypothetical protein
MVAWILGVGEDSPGEEAGVVAGEVQAIKTDKKDTAAVSRQNSFIFGLI